MAVAGPPASPPAPAPAPPAAAPWYKRMRLPAELRTSEGRAHLFLQVLFGLNTLNVYHLLPQRYSALAQAIIAAGYAVSRGIGKAGQVPGK
jgi:hypothetical protein